MRKGCAACWKNGARARCPRLTQVAMLSGKHLEIDAMDVAVVPSNFLRLAVWHGTFGPRTVVGIELTPLGKSAPWRRDYRYSEPATARNINDSRTSGDRPLEAATPLLRLNPMPSRPRQARARSRSGRPASNWIVGRGLCMYRLEDFTAVPRGRRRAALDFKLPLWSPFERVVGGGVGREEVAVQAEAGTATQRCPPAGGSGCVPPVRDLPRRRRDRGRAGGSGDRHGARASAR